MTGSTRIARVHGRRVWDSRGRPTVEAEIVLAGGAVGRAIAPSGASRGRHEATDLRDGGDAFGGLGVSRAVAGIDGEIAPALDGIDAADQVAVDTCLIDLDGTPTKARLGGNATIAVSMAAAHAAAAARGLPLWRHVGSGEAPVLPMPMVQIFGGGAHADGRLDLQDFMVMPLAADSFDRATAMTAEIYRAAGALMAERGRLRGVADEGGWWPEFDANEDALDELVRAIERAGFRPGEDAAIALDIAASQFGTGGRYRLAAEAADLDGPDFVDMLAGWCARYPIVSVEDPAAEDDDASMVRFTAAVGERVQVVGDDYLVTSAARIERAAVAGACNAALIKPNQAGTLTETRAALDAARRAGWHAVVSARSGESEDVTIVHLAIGWGADQLKVGSITRSERLAKWNEAIRIEDAASGTARFVGRAAVGGQARRRTAS